MHLPGLLLIALLILAGSLGGWIAQRLRLPALFGQIMAGVLLGQLASDDMLHESQAAFTPFFTFALSLVAVTVGGHLEFRRLHNAKRRILYMAIVQTLFTFALVFAVLQLLNPLHLAEQLLLPVHLLLASIASATSPATTIHLIRERQARGLLVKTTVAVLAISNLVTLILFEVIRAFDISLLKSGELNFQALLPAGAGILLAVIIGLVAGYGLVYHTRKHLVKLRQNNREASLVQAELFSAFLVTMFLCDGLCELIRNFSPDHSIAPSPILANIMLGLVLANKSTFKEELLGLFNVLEHAVFSMFYVQAGAHLQFEELSHVGMAATVFFIVRVLGKVGGGWLGGVLSRRSTPRLSMLIGPMMLSQGAISVSLVIVLEQYDAFHEIIGMVTATVLTGVVLAELITAPIIATVINRAGEASRDRTRLIQFLQEEFILPKVNVKDKRDALEQMVTFLCQTHPIDARRDEVMQAILEREERMPTGIGHGIAVPHAIVGEGEDIFGVLGLLNPPVDFGAPDGEPARLVILICTPENQKKRHLEVIAAVTRMLRDEKIRERLYKAQSAGEIHEIIDSEEADTFNYFLDT